MTNYHKLVLDLEKIVEGDVLCDHKTLEKYSRDASLFTVRPQIVVYPKDKFDIQAIVKHVNSLKALTTPGGRDDISLSITARAAGTDMSGGPLNDSIILDTTKYMHKIFKKNFVKENFFVECEPGTYFRDLEKILDTYGLMFPSYPASKDLCCLGGMVSNNSSGEKSLLYGSTKDWLEEVEVVLSDGSIHLFKEISFDELDELIQSSTQDILTKRTKVFEIYTNIFNLISENKHLIESEKPKVSKNSSGYYLWECINWDKQTINLAKLICGSQGTLGIVTKTKLKLVNKPKYSQMLTVFLPNLGDLVNIVESILEHKPESIETFDDNTFQIAMKFLPNIIWKLKGNIFNLAFSFLPEAWMALTGGIPKLILMAEFTGETQDEADQKADFALENIKKFGHKCRVTRDSSERQKYWLFRRESFNLLRGKMKGFRTAPFVEDVIVPMGSMQDFIPEMQKLMNKYKFLYTIAGHAGNGNFHIIPLMKLGREEEVERIKKTSQEVFSLVKKYGGSISAEHNDGFVRTPYLHFMFSVQMLELFKQVKNIFDPLNIFNPNKKVGGSVEENFRKIELTKTLH